MLILSGLVNDNFHIGSVVNLLQDVLVHVSCIFRLVSYLVVQSHDFLGGSKFAEVLVVEVVDGDLVVDLVHGCVLHNVQDTLLLGQLVQAKTRAFVLNLSKMEELFVLRP